MLILQNATFVISRAFFYYLCTMHKRRVAIIGAGAAGCFAAQRLRELSPHTEVIVFESQARPLRKVAITGGGRCNLTNTFQQVTDLRQVYPRGHQLMRRLMYSWSQWDTMSWFEDHGVKLVVQEDECVFPQSQNAMEIVQTLKAGLDIRCGIRARLEDMDDYDAIIVATGGSRDFSWLHTAGVDIVSPIPSLFPFKLQACGLEQLSGALVEDCTVSMAGTNFRSQGIMLITHNGLSGPCVLRLSSYAARYLAEHSYSAPIVVNWLGDATEQQAQDMLLSIASSNGQKQVSNTHPSFLTSRLWQFLLSRAGLNAGERWNSISRRQYNKLVSVLTSDQHQMVGRVPHKEEFVTAGGISLGSINPATLESKQRPGLYFAGEVLDVDGVTGGFNLQAAWTMADAVARDISSRFNN